MELTVILVSMVLLNVLEI